MAQGIEGIGSASLIRARNGAGPVHSHLSSAIQELASGIGASLALGDMDLLGQTSRG